MPAAAKPGLSRRALAFIVLGAVVLLALVIGLLVLTITRDSREGLTLAEVVAPVGTDGYASEALSDVSEDTADLCEGVPGCLEAYSGDAVNLYRFDSKQQAAEFSSAHKDSHQSDWIVVVYHGSLSLTGRSNVETYIDTLWTSE